MCGNMALTEINTKKNESKYKANVVAHDGEPSIIKRQRQADAWSSLSSQPGAPGSERDLVTGNKVDGI